MGGIGKTLNFMRKIKTQNKTSISINNSVEGETIEEKIRRIIDNKEPITEGAEVIYTDRGDGILPEFDVRTDRFELAVDAMDKVHRDKLAKREERMKAIKGGAGEGKDEGKDEGKTGDSAN